MESVNEGNDDVVFTIDDGNLDNKFLMTKSLSRNLDYQHDSGDQYYVLPKRDFDRLEDYADSHGYDTDEVIHVIEESVNEARTKVNEAFKLSDHMGIAAEDVAEHLVDKLIKDKSLTQFIEALSMYSEDYTEEPARPKHRQMLEDVLINIIRS